MVAELSKTAYLRISAFYFLLKARCEHTFQPKSGSWRKMLRLFIGLQQATGCQFIRTYTIAKCWS